MKGLIGAIVLVAVTLAASACASSHRGISAPPMPGTVPSTPADIAISRVQKSNAFNNSNAFRGSGFQKAQTKYRCPTVGALGAGHIEATCQTRVTTTDGYRTALVTFAEFWPARQFRTSGPPHGTLHHYWRFEVRPNGQVVRLHDVGGMAPQMAP
jgi:hypothetical protein